MPRLDPRGADRARSDSLPRSRQACRHARHSGMAQFLFQIADVRTRALPGARPLHPVNEIKKYVALDDGRGPDHSPGPGILRLTAFAANRRFALILLVGSVGDEM